jgi:hypothetical protein
MAADSELLSRVSVASPCPASWDRMEGDDRVRYCSQCRLNVYNLSAMSAAEAEALVREREGRLCVRFYRRRDGTMLTSNCPVGVQRARRWVALRLTWLGGLLGVSAIAGTLGRYGAPTLKTEAFQKVRHSRLATYEPFRTIFDRIDPRPNPFVTLGEMAAPSAIQPGGWINDR